MWEFRTLGVWNRLALASAGVLLYALVLGAVLPLWSERPWGPALVVLAGVVFTSLPVLLVIALPYRVVLNQHSVTEFALLGPSSSIQVSGIRTIGVRASRRGPALVLRGDVEMLSLPWHHDPRRNEEMLAFLDVLSETPARYAFDADLRDYLEQRRTAGHESLAYVTSAASSVLSRPSRMDVVVLGLIIAFAIVICVRVFVFM